MKEVQGQHRKVSLYLLCKTHPEPVRTAAKAVMPQALKGLSVRERQGEQVSASLVRDSRTQAGRSTHASADVTTESRSGSPDTSKQREPARGRIQLLLLRAATVGR